MCAKIFLCLLLISLTVLYHGASTLMQSESIFIIEEELSNYSFSCPPGQLVGLSADRMTLLFYDVEKQQLVMSKDLPLQGQLIQSSVDGKLHVITHDAYVTIVENYELKTYSVPAIKASSIVIVNELVCITPTIESSSALFMCFNLRNGSDRWHNCGDDIHINSGDPAFVDTVKPWVYILGPYLSNQRYTLSVNHECLDRAVSNSNPLDPDSGSGQIWFSYDGSRIFLNNGMTLFASNDDNDMKLHGDFNASHKQYHYNYFSQSSIPPYNVAGIRTDINTTIHYYGWPYLMPVADSAKSIPIPPQARAGAAEEVHMCDTDGISVTYALVKYSFLGGTTKTGVVVLK